VGIFDAGYLTYEHFQKVIPPCTIGAFSDCGKVLQSKYAIVFGIPLALIGLVHYTLEAVILSLAILKKNAIYRQLAVLLSVIGLLSSIYFVVVMLLILKAVCVYCLVSAGISFLLFLIVPQLFWEDRKILTAKIFGISYRYLFKPILFLFDPEFIHVNMILIGNTLGRLWIGKKITNYLFHYPSPVLSQNIASIHFENPIGLATGFDYEAKLTQILPEIGFGFGSVGTITNFAYEGNTRPMLGRLPKSRSLMVNKGYKNLGAKQTIANLAILNFKYPVGISIGRTNSLNLATQEKSIKDIVHAFKLFEASNTGNKYYELNISCPNLHGDVSFYPAKNLDDLLIAVDKIKISRPIFVKMPIEESNAETLKMLKIIAKHKISGVIFGNLTKNRLNPKLDPAEVAKFPVGNFSGKPCFDRSNELISLCYKHFSSRLVIIGCGGVFCAKDAFEKIQRGASLVQLITGMIFEGPQLISSINIGIEKLLKIYGYNNISQAIGSKNYNS